MPRPRKPPVPPALPMGIPVLPIRRIALLAVDSPNRGYALAEAEATANERSAALMAAGATVLSIRTQVVYGSPWHVIVTIEYEGGA